jgi:uncharacterized protein (TIGR02679 family)
MSSPLPMVPDTLLAWAKRRGPAAVLAAARARLEAGQRGTRLTLAAVLDDSARREVSELLGLEWRAGQGPVTLGQLRTALRKHGVELEDVLVACGGPLVDTSVERAADLAARADEADAAYAALLDVGVPAAAVSEVVARRWLGRPGQVLRTAEQLASVWASLPAPAGTLLATFAGDMFGDPHSLDKDQLLGRAAARLIAVAGHAPGGDGGGTVGALEPEGWRAVWASVGVTCDRVSSTVLVLNLSIGCGDPLDAAGDLVDPHAATLRRVCTAAAATGEPVWLTSRVLSSGFRLSPGSCAGVVVRVCENPAVVEAAADELSAGAPPLVCTYGRPSLAARALLTALAEAGAQVLVTADRDDAGCAILAGLLADVPEAREWLPDAEGMYEENRLRALLEDLRSASRSTAPVL